MADIQVFAPVYRGALGIDVLNERLRAVLNPDGRPVLGGRLRTGDKLMLSGRNLHDLGLMNGTVLRLVEHDEDGETLTVTAEGAVLALPEEEAPGLRLAYACSVHRGQGIELPVAVLIAHPAAGAFFLRREMLYTAMTRATTATVVVGTPRRRRARGGDAGHRAALRPARRAAQADPRSAADGLRERLAADAAALGARVLDRELAARRRGLRRQRLAQPPGAADDRRVVVQDHRLVGGVEAQPHDAGHAAARRAAGDQPALRVDHRQRAAQARAAGRDARAQAVRAHASRCPRRRA